MLRGNPNGGSTRGIIYSLPPIPEDFSPSPTQELKQFYNLLDGLKYKLLQGLKIEASVCESAKGFEIHHGDPIIKLENEVLLELFENNYLNDQLLSACRLHSSLAKFAMEHDELKKKLPLEETTLPTDLERIKNMFRFGFKRAKLECDDQHVYDLNLTQVTVDKINNSPAFFILNLCTFFMPVLILITVDILVTFAVNATNSIKGFIEGMYYGWHWAGRNVPEITSYYFNKKPALRVCENAVIVEDRVSEEKIETLNPQQVRGNNTPQSSSSSAGTRFRSLYQTPQKKSSVEMAETYLTHTPTP